MRKAIQCVKYGFSNGFARMTMTSQCFLLMAIAGGVACTSAIAAPVTSGMTIAETVNDCTPPMPGSDISPRGGTESLWGECSSPAYYGILPFDLIWAEGMLPEAGPIINTAVMSYASYGGVQGCSSLYLGTAIGVTTSLPSSPFSIGGSAAGNGWTFGSRPVIQMVLANSSAGEASGVADVDRLVLILSPTKVLNFLRSSDDATAFYGVNGATGAFKLNTKQSGDYASTWEYHDQSGQIYTFFGFTTDSGYGAVKGQLWKVTNANGGSGASTGYLGDATTINTAITNGFYNSGGITSLAENWYDSAGRKVTYTYANLLSGGPRRCTSITTTTVGGTPVTLAKLEMDYYDSTTAASGKGSVGDLMKTTSTVYLSGGGTTTKTHYMRYYTASWSSGAPGSPSQIKLVVEPEGCRQYGVSNLASASDADLRPYASKYVEYYSDTGSNGTTTDAFRSYKVWKLTSNTDCGCSMLSPTDTVEFNYEANSATPTSSYDAVGAWGTSGWRSRTTIKNPDTSYNIVYLDEFTQKLADIKTDGDPTSGSTHFWVTRYERDSVGRITSVFTPESISGYTHSTGAMTMYSSDGLITTMEYGSASNIPGPAATRTLHQKGTTGSAFVDSEIAYLTTGSSWKKTLGTGGAVIIARPFPTSQRVYKNEVTVAGSAAADRDETTIAYTFHSSSWLPKTITRTMPVVSSGTNGDNSILSTVSYLREDGRMVFSATADSRYNFIEYDASTGQVTQQITDAKSGTSVSTLNTAATAFSITLPAGGTHIATTYTFDAQGRPDTTTLPTGRIAANYYTKLNDGRLVTLSSPRVTGGTTYYGPVSYSVSNLAGGSEASGVLSLAGSSNDATTIGSWIDTSKSDPLEAVSSTYATLSRLTTTIYNKTGQRAVEQKTWTVLGTTLSSGSTADTTKIGYDVMGRTVRTEDPTGTISRTEYDLIGRPVARWIGTNDNSFPGGSSGTDNMTKVETRVYDNGTFSSGLGGNSRLTRRSSDEDGDWSTTTGDQRHTDFIYDYRGRLIVQTNPVAPHAVFKYDNRGRRIAAGTYATTSGFTSAKDPTDSTSSDRLSLSETFYDERGQVWKSIQRKITQSSGNIDSGGELETFNWYDYNGRLIKTVSPSGLSKMVYDRLDRVERTYTLASTNDSAYADADDVAGDIVLEEQVTNYQNTSSNVLASYSISRDPGMSVSTTGALDTGTNGTDVLVDTELAGDARPQITAMFYDDWDRPIATVQYGTYGMDAGSATFTRSSITSVPSRSATVLVSETTYTKDGLPEIAADPLNQKTMYAYDEAGRRILTVSNYDSSVNSGMPSGAFNNFVRNEYTNGLQTKLWVDLDGDNTQDTGDQVTLYTYGVTKGTLGSGSPVQSLIASNRLLRQTTYPDSAGGTDVVTSAYNALGEKVWEKDQNGTIIKTTMDTGGRQAARIADTLGTNIDGAVRRIALTYTNRGQPLKVTQYDNTSGGNVVNEVQYTYDDYGYTEQLDQDFDSAVGASGASHRTVTFSNTRAAPTNGRTSVRRTAMGLADGSSIGYTFSNSSSLDDVTGRVTSVTLTPSGGSPTTMAEYEYLGRSNLVTTELNPGWISSVRGATAGTFDGLDDFNRIKVSRWTDGTNDRQRFNVKYDEASNIVSVEDPILDNATGGTPAFDKTFSLGLTMDGRNRITEATRGVMTSGSIGGSARMDQIWALDQVGNWDNVKTDLNGNSNGTDSGEVNENRTFNNANEMLTRSTAPRSLTHDAAGQLTHDGNNTKFTYDAFGRLVRVYMYVIPSGLSGTIAEYKYDGLGQRIGWHCDLNADDDVTTADPWMWFIYDDRWRIVNTYRLAYSGGNWNVDSSAKERFVHHAAGIDGKGGSSYIDAVILSDRDLTNTWSGAADGTLEARLYHLQNWRNDLCAVADDMVLARHYRYSAYGTRTEIDAGDYNRDGVTDIQDITDFGTDLNNNDPRADYNNDDPTGHMPDFSDYLDFAASYSVTSDGHMHAAPRGLYAGYEHDPALEYQGALSGGGAGIYTIESYAHVRFRVFSTEMGRWTRWDPLGYTTGMSAYEYSQCMTLLFVDPTGLVCQRGDDDFTMPRPVPFRLQPPPPTPPTTITPPPLPPGASCIAQARAWLASSPGVAPGCAWVAVEAYLACCNAGGTNCGQAATFSSMLCTPPFVIAPTCLTGCNAQFAASGTACETAFDLCLVTCGWFATGCKAACRMIRDNCFTTAQNTRYWCQTQCNNLSSFPPVPPVVPGPAPAVPWTQIPGQPLPWLPPITMPPTPPGWPRSFPPLTPIWTPPLSPPLPFIPWIIVPPSLLPLIPLIPPSPITPVIPPGTVPAVPYLPDPLDPNLHL